MRVPSIIPASKRYLTTLSPSTTHLLTNPSPYIRCLPASSASSDSVDLRDDFALYPNYFDPSESSELLRAALWRLDKSDVALRRRRSRPEDADKGIESVGDLQKLFRGAYGFEEVCDLRWVVMIKAYGHARAITILLFITTGKPFYPRFHHPQSHIPT
jgi:hypothetical protein